ncbi:unnamed protein product [Brassica napus]|uniref:(rape) hypothetical protein n=1 Tax=Brassica napus TaxID=3708 RepID=A0A816XP56_BRANA|nr:unnamed protein product [Brassica napus]
MFRRHSLLLRKTQHLQTSEGDQSDETPSEQNQAEENLKDTTEPTTELVSTYVSKMPPITQQTDHLQTSAIDFSEKNEVEVSRLLAHFQIGAEVEILSTDDEIWYPGKVVDLKLCEGLEELTVEYTTLFTDQHRLQKLQDTITADKIRPATPTSDQKSFEMMDKVEAFYNNGWSSGQISMICEFIENGKMESGRWQIRNSDCNKFDNILLGVYCLIKGEA